MFLMSNHKAYRGTSLKYLRYSCYQNDTSRAAASQPDPFYVPVDSPEDALRRSWAHGKLLADTCYEKLKDVGSLIGTAFVARDVMQIVDALGQGTLLNYHGK